MGLPESTGLAPRLSSLLNGLPQGAFLANAGLFPARSTSALRVVVAGVRLVDVRLLLKRLDALQVLESVLGVLGQVDDVCGVRCGLSLDLSARGVGSRLGVELYSAGVRDWTSAPRSAWRPLLDRLAERGFCTAGQAVGLVEWIGTERLFSDRRMYRLVRGVNHVKVSVGVGDPAAKAYAGARHLSGGPLGPRRHDVECVDVVVIGLSVTLTVAPSVTIYFSMSRRLSSGVPASPCPASGQLVDRAGSAAGELARPRTCSPIAFAVVSGEQSAGRSTVKAEGPSVSHCSAPGRTSPEEPSSGRDRRPKPRAARRQRTAAGPSTRRIRTSEVRIRSSRRYSATTATGARRRDASGTLR